MAHLSCGYGSIRTHRAARADPNLPRQQASGYHPRNPSHRAQPQQQLQEPRLDWQQRAEVALPERVPEAVAEGRLQGLAQLPAQVGAVAQRLALEVVAEVPQQPAAVGAAGLPEPLRASVGRL